MKDVVSEAIPAVIERKTPIAIYVLLVAVSAIWGGNLIVSKLAVAVVPPFTLAALRFLIMAVCMLALLYGRKEQNPKIGGRDILSFTILGLTGVAGFFVLFLLALQRAPSSDGALFQGMSPLLSSVMAVFVADERLTWPKTIGLTISLAGVGFVVLSRAGAMPIYEGTRLTGDVAFAAAAICWAAYAAYGRAAMQRFSSLSTTAYSTLIGFIVLVPLALTENPWQALQAVAVSPYALALIGYVVLLAGFFCFVFWNAGVKQIGAARAGAFYNLLPVFGLVFAYVFLNEQVGPAHVIGVAMVIVGAWLTNRQTSTELTQ